MELLVSLKLHFALFHYVLIPENSENKSREEDRTEQEDSKQEFSVRLLHALIVQPSAKYRARMGRKVCCNLK